MYLGRKGNISIPKGFTEGIIIDSGGFQLQVGVDAIRKPSVASYSFWLETEALPNNPEIDGYMNLDVLSTATLSKVVTSKTIKKESMDQKDLFGKDIELPDEEEVIEELDRPTKEKMDSRKKSAELTFKNQEYMEKQGLRPIPVWHAGEPEDYLGDYCKRYDYVAIGGISSLGTPGKSYILNLLTFVKEKYPNVKFHLFGIGISGLLAFKSLRPYSIDFSTWGVPARYGHDLVEDKKQLLKEIKLPPEIRENIKDDGTLEEEYLRGTIRKIKMLETNLQKFHDPYQRLLL